MHKRIKQLLLNIKSKLFYFSDKTHSFLNSDILRHKSDKIRHYSDILRHKLNKFLVNLTI